MGQPQQVPTIGREQSEETYIYPETNDEYHGRILNEFDIPNNHSLNSIYYKSIPKIDKEDLLTTDFSKSFEDNKVKGVADRLLPSSLFMNCNSLCKE